MDESGELDQPTEAPQAQPGVTNFARNGENFTATLACAKCEAISEVVGRGNQCTCPRCLTVIEIAEAI